jgi:hypothetical protein
LHFFLSVGIIIRIGNFKCLCGQIINTI